jgi:hypothetical protein
MFSALDGHRIISVELPSSAWKAKATGPLALNPRAARFAGSFPAEERLILTWTENYLLVAAASVSVYYWGLPSQLTDVAGYLAGQKHGQAVFQSEGSLITEALGLVSSPTQGESRELELSVEKGELVLFVRSTAGAEGSAEARVSLAAAYPDAKLGAYNLSLFRDMVKAAGDTALLTFTRQGANTPLWSERPGFTALVMPYAENEAQGKKETERLKEAA